MDSATHNGEGGVGPIHRDHEGLGTWGMVRVPSLPCLLAWLAVPSERREIRIEKLDLKGSGEALNLYRFIGAGEGGLKQEGADWGNASSYSSEDAMM